MKKRAVTYVTKSKKKWGNQFDYSQTEYINKNTPFTLRCNIHDETFTVSPRNHTLLGGCPECRRLQKQEAYLDFVKNVHGDKYDYSKLKFTGIYEQVIVICPTHGEFSLRATNLKEGRGCKECATEIRNAVAVSRRLIHGDKFSYELVDYIHDSTSVSIVCKKHGEFKQTPNAHKAGHGCPRCGIVISKGQQEVADFMQSILDA